MIEALDLLARGGALGIMLMIGAVLFMRPVPRRKALAVAAFALCAACYLLVSTPGGPFGAGVPGVLLVAGAVIAPLAFTWMVLEIFFERAEERWPWLAFAGLVVIATAATFLAPDLQPVRGGLAILLYLGLIWLAVRTDADDLVETRRLFRRWFVGLMALTGLAISLVELGLDPDTLPQGAFLLQSLAFLCLTALFGVWLVGADTTLWPAMRAPVRPAAPGRAASQDAQLSARIAAAMDEDEVWREEGLTIGALARRLSMPEHRLRRVINGELGHRNFSSFVNGYRIEAARRALDDPEQAGRTVLEIAYASGFASLGPFNRAFRARTGLSPTQYRNRER